MDVKRMIDVADANANVERGDFRNVLFLGPAVVTPLGSLTVIHDTCDAPSPEAMFIQVPQGKPIVGVIGLRNNRFENCRFQKSPSPGRQRPSGAAPLQGPSI
jgi:hypothetical protein